ncbi:MAG: acetyl/propionyl/methylcrotonyl-CoA carboxylase subunit alpha [Betaproteobacteria bacterium]|nr:acetyl/propionyl/methylcrotonyl-CoA carboxylase subunit alpha [Betaproteobacteria bacterium]
MFDKILIANRGEIACRIIRTCRRMAIRTVAVYSEADAEAQHVHQADEAYLIGGPRPVDSYLKGDVIIEVAKKSGAQAIHPGYGFLSENEDFARAVEAAGMAFIGPTPEAIEKMGLKDQAKKIMQAAGVPVVPGYHGDSQDPTFLHQQAESIGYPVLVKAVAGGGGKGMRLVEQSGEFAAQLEAAQREARNAFGDDRVLIERFVKGPHHIEFQVFGDTHGNYAHLYERECSIQRRHQKILEETPSPYLDEAMRTKMGDAAVAAAEAIGYRGAGTIEFIAGEDREFFFMEMNTRLQVEHPITEMITGEDLVEWQLRVAAGEPLPLLQDEIVTGGHAIEVRICAEDPQNQFLPEIGRLERFVHPDGDDDDIRLDTGVVEGDEISIYYDPMIAKLIVWGEDRSAAIRRMRQALTETAVIGCKTNLGFLQRLLHHPAYVQGDTATSFIGEYSQDLLPARTPLSGDVLDLAATRILVDEADELSAATTEPNSPWNSLAGWRVNAPPSRIFAIKPGVGGRDGEEIRHRLNPMHLAPRQDATVIRSGDALQIILPDRRYDLHYVDPHHYEAPEAAAEGRLTALMPGRVVKLFVQAGDAVKKGQPLLIMEAMKMEHTIASPKDGVIERVAYAVNDMVQADALLFAFAE